MRLVTIRAVLETIMRVLFHDLWIVAVAHTTGHLEQGSE